MKYVLVIAGSDSSGGAGIQADIKTITGLGVHPLTVITALTAQNSLRIDGIHPVPGSFVLRQLEVVLSDVRPDAVKIGMIYSRAAIHAVVTTLRRYDLLNVVLDPVLAASTGASVLMEDAVAFYRGHLVPLASIVTPNLREAEALAGIPVRSPEDMVAAAKSIQRMGPSVVVTGGHLEGSARDLFWDGRAARWFSDPRIETAHTHGSGCVFSSALAVFLAEGLDTVDAVKMAHDFTRCAILNSYGCGRGAGPVAPWTAGRSFCASGMGASRDTDPPKKGR
jgi:hydroxymethylpyrimidine kinase/phosphomethylpyrimidine kinase